MKKRFSVGIMTVALAFGIAVSGYSQTDPDLNGTWEAFEDGNRYVIVFDNGNYLLGIDDASKQKGTFTTTGDTITFYPTHIHRSAFELADGPKWLDCDAAMSEDSSSAYRFEPDEFRFLLEGDRLSLIADGGGKSVLTKLN